MAKGKKQKPVDSAEAEAQEDDSVDHSEESSGEYRRRKKAKKAKKAWPDGTSLAEEPKPDKTGKKRKAVEILSAASEAPPAKAARVTAPPAKAERVTADPKRGVFAGGIPRTSEESAVRTHFEQCGEIQEFKYPSNARGVRMGFVLVTFASEKAVAKALKLTGSMFEGSKISVAIQENKERPAKSEKKKSGDANGAGGQANSRDPGAGKGKDRGKAKGKGKGKHEDEAEEREGEVIDKAGGLKLKLENKAKSKKGGANKKHKKDGAGVVA